MRGKKVVLFLTSLLLFGLAQTPPSRRYEASLQTFLAALASGADLEGIVLASLPPKDPAWPTLIQAAGSGNTGLIVLATVCPEVSVGGKQVYRLGGKTSGTFGLLRVKTTTFFLSEKGRGVFEVLEVSDPQAAFYGLLRRQAGLDQLHRAAPNLPRCP